MTRAVRRWPNRPPELFDGVAGDPATAAASLKDITKANRFLGGTAAALRRLEEFFGDAGRGATLTLLDVGTGCGDIPRAAARRAARAGIGLRLLGLERHPTAARMARGPAGGGAMAVFRGDARSLPLRDRSVDLVLCSQLLHHYAGEDVRRIIAELERVARVGVVIADLRPSALAAAGLWVASFPLRFDPVSRRDGVTSVWRGFTPRALERACAEAGVAARVRTHPGYRVTAAWRRGNGSRP